MAFARTPGPQKYVYKSHSVSTQLNFIKSTQSTYSNLGLELRVGARKVLASLDRLAHAAVDVLPVWTAEHGARTEERERVVFSTGIVDCNVPEHVLGNLLREIDVDTQEVGCNQMF